MVLFDHRLGVLAKRDLRVVGEHDLQPRVGSRDQLVLEGDGHALYGLGAVARVHDAHITLQALHHADAILALRAAGLRQHQDEEKRRAEERETRESSLTLHVESILCHGRSPRSARTRTGAGAYDTRIRTQLYMKCYCLPTAPGLPLYKAETSVRLRFLGCSRTSRCLPVSDDVGYRM
jgi:hypothetical protein